MAMVIEFISSGRNAGKRNSRRVYHAVTGTVEDRKKTLLVTACGLRLHKRSCSHDVINKDEFERCPVCRRERFKGYRRT